MASRNLSRVTASQHAEGVLQRLMGTGMVRTLLRAKCSHCRANMQLDPDHLSDNVHCDFCGQEVRLARYTAWGSPKWAYRLAGHLQSHRCKRWFPCLRLSANWNSFLLFDAQAIALSWV